MRNIFDYTVSRVLLLIYLNYFLAGTGLTGFHVENLIKNKDDSVRFIYKYLEKQRYWFLCGVFLTKYILYEISILYIMYVMSSCVIIENKERIKSAFWRSVHIFEKILDSSTKVHLPSFPLKLSVPIKYFSLISLLYQRVRSNTTLYYNWFINFLCN